MGKGRNLFGGLVVLSLAVLSGCNGIIVGGRQCVDRRNVSDRAVLVEGADGVERGWGNYTDLTAVYMSTGEFEKARGVTLEAAKEYPCRAATCMDVIVKYENFFEKNKNKNYFKRR